MPIRYCQTARQVLYRANGPLFDIFRSKIGAKEPLNLEVLKTQLWFTFIHAPADRTRLALTVTPYTRRHLHLYAPQLGVQTTRACDFLSVFKATHAQAL